MYSEHKAIISLQLLKHSSDHKQMSFAAGG